MNIIFVCTGNTCRSPMAEAIAKHLCKKEDVKIFSRGLNTHNEPLNPHSALALSKMEITPLIGHKATTLSAQDIVTADIILTMTASQKKAIISAFPTSWDKVDTLSHFCTGINKDITDPFGGTIAQYMSCCEEIYKCISNMGVIK